MESDHVGLCHSTLPSIRDVADAIKEQSFVSNSIAQQVEKIVIMVDVTTAAMQSNAETSGNMEKISSELNRRVSCFGC